MIRFLHTADLQIGKPFNWAEGRAQTKLREAREDAVSRIGEVAQEYEADFVVVAGDFFDDNTVGDDVVSRTCERLSDIEVPVYILPGNHDFAGSPSCVYRRDLFQTQKPEHVHALLANDPVFVGAETPEAASVVILPAPVERRHERGDPTRHIDAEFGPTGLPRIGLAHGGVEDFGEGEATSRIDPTRAETSNLDYLALGDWHGTKKIGNSTWYSGTPETDSFKQNNPGNVLVVEVSDSGAPPNVETISTGMYNWIKKDVTLQSPEDLDALERWFDGIDDPLRALVRLELEGGLGLEAMSRLEALKDQLENLVLEVRHRGNVQPRASAEELQKIASDGYVGSTVEALQALSSGEGEEAKTAHRALQLLYQFHHKQEAS